MLIQRELPIRKVRVPSKSAPGTFHVVSLSADGQFRCDCQGFYSARKAGRDCSHIKLVKTKWTTNL